jgi:hypothetical protein
MVFWTLLSSSNDWINRTSASWLIVRPESFAACSRAVRVSGFTRNPRVLDLPAMGPAGGRPRFLPTFFVFAITYPQPQFVEHIVEHLLNLVKRLK